MNRKVMSVSISVFCSALLALFLFPVPAYADNPQSDVDVIELIDQAASETQAVTTTVTTVTTINDIAVSAVNDILDVLVDNDIVYADDLSDNLYAAIEMYIMNDNTEYVVEVVREDVHELIISSISDEYSIDYEDNIRKYIDKVYDDIFVVAPDNQDTVFLQLVSITLLFCILTCLIFSYFVQ